jgi:hypothetical protein
MSFDQPNIITLGTQANGNEYVITGEVVQQPANNFAEGIRQGSPQYSDIENVFHYTYEDFREGQGVKFGNAREDRFKFWNGARVRTWDSEGHIELAPLVTEASIGAIVPSFAYNTVAVQEAFCTHISNFRNYLWAAIGDTVMRYQKDTIPWVADGPSGAEAGNRVAADITHSLYAWRNDAGNTHLYWGLGKLGSFAWADPNFYRRDMSANVGAVTAWEQPSAGEKAHDFIDFDKKLLKIYFGEIKSSVDGAVWTTLMDVHAPGNFQKISKWVGVAVTPVGTFVPYCVRNGNLYAINISSRQYAEVYTGYAPTDIIDATVFGDEVVVTNGKSVKLIHPDRPLREIGIPAMKNGMVYTASGVEYTPLIARLFSVGTYLLASVVLVRRGGGGTALGGVWLYSGGGWHMPTDFEVGAPPGLLRAGPGEGMGIFNGSNVFDIDGEFWFFTINSSDDTVIPHRIEKAKNFEKQFSVDNPEYAAGGSIITPWFDGGFAEMDGTIIEIVHHSTNLSVDETVQVQYQTDGDESSWTVLGTFNTSPVQTLKWASGQGLAVKKVRFQFVMARASGDSTKTPIWHSMVLKYIKRPKLRSRIDFTVDVTRTAERRQVSTETIIDELYGLIDINPLLVFSYTGEEVKYVQMVALPRQDFLSQSGEGTKTAIMRVQLLEPVGA